ncbi:rossmann-fold NAD-binding domain-containing protein [Klebsormidium nitens]|uniref:Rossmann-fold NAD-binding domain-containing protein n=1 Tax=Klebsormidium nitens TaxID=105231 RepID=A0A1Y1IKT7_KLENI|nr:rossmann-fold NAD-binding domain-containing protein [Klebsormidium nitens]|eukprot:GAQ90039.1 rossmann-fold NAD-binding domain-containing protein [Klebsormidium nitens]
MTTTSHMIPYFLGLKGPTGFSSRSTAEETSAGVDLTGRVAIVTGASSGLGIETARVLALRGAEVVIGVRRVNAGEETKEVILKSIPNAKIHVLELDLGSLASVREFVKNFKELKLPLNILINNAGVMACPFGRTKDGHELQFGTNHLAHFLLTELLLPLIKQTAKDTGIQGRIVILASSGHDLTYPGGIRFDKLDSEEGYDPYRAYGQSKLANLLHAKELARRLKEENANVIVNALHPGVIQTGLARHMPKIAVFFIKTFGGLALKSIPQGAATSLFLATNPKVTVSGEYWADSNIAARSDLARDDGLAKRLYEVSLDMTKP